MTKKEILAFIAGLFEGEGSISIDNHTQQKSYTIDYNLRVRISNTDRPLLEWVTNNYGGKIYRNSTVNNKTVWCWLLTSRKAEQFLITMMPYLICKKERALLALEFRKTIDTGNHAVFYRIPKNVSQLRSEYYSKMKLLNAKGGIRGGTTIAGAVQTKKKRKK